METGVEEGKTSAFAHVSVLSREVVAGLNIVSGGHYLDATVGGGGHSQLILTAAPEVQITAIDRDTQAIAAAKAKLTPYRDRVHFWQGNFAEYEPVDTLFEGIIADLGVSSAQLDLPERGFSFRHRADLDMRMDQRQSLSAADVINHWSEVQLADVFYKYGEERLSRRIARAIVEKRPFQTTSELAEVIASSVPRKYRYGRIHPATRVFQALRIVVNQEIESLETFVNKAPHWLKPGGIIAMISFHSLEDRIIKHSLRDSPILKVLTKKPVTPQAQELENNRRSRSAKLRLAQRIGQESF
ncbi:MAG: 16S rRNA (cytosine(1402)-N(4))-methyltransferase RsmH [Merismopedia sp. SIO2A8]|nr:16S rRNA (cytosine(1402)-N(4))-methyltransferase RsmH [Symploca sp. SIO2B6]NET54056.1 16S rRNA (cytosine(1402)-N(4))-methyltransferase RsmH [Merismopedia sp. SIO2A8]